MPTFAIPFIPFSNVKKVETFCLKHLSYETFTGKKCLETNGNHMKHHFVLLFLLSLLSCTKNTTMAPSQTSSSSPTQKDTITYLALGDSYTKGESVVWEQNWPNQLVAKLNDTNVLVKNIEIIAQTGWRTDNLQNAIVNQKPAKADLVSLLIGVNNYYQGRSVESFEPEFENLLDTAISYANGHKEKVFVLSIPDYGYTPLGASRQAEITKGLEAYNKVCKKACKAKGVLFMNITDITQKGLEQPTLVANDGLHPSAEAYKLFVDRIFDKVYGLVKGK
jgi:lysophospholipase L1-like esterase